METKKKALFLIFAFILSLILMFCVGEIVVRVFNLSKTVNSYPWMSNPDFTLPNFFTPEGKKFIGHTDLAFENPYHPELIPNNSIAIRDVKFYVNKYGFRGREEYGDMPAQAYKRIILIGDSVTFGYLQDEEGLFSTLIRKELAKRHKVEVLNFAITGNDTYGNFYVIKRAVRDFSPDMIVYQFGLNDVKVGHKAQEEKKEVEEELVKRNFSSRLKQMGRRSALYLFLAERYNYIRLKSGKKNWAFNQWVFSDDCIKEELGHFQDIYKFLEKNKVPMLFVFFPDDWQVFSSNSEAVKCQRSFERFWRDKGWPYLDLTEVFKDAKDPYGLFLDNCHLSSQGHLLTAKYLSPHIEKMLKEIQ